MSSNLIQQSLIDIEQNLRKLESARNQVGSLASKSEELVLKVTDLVSSVEIIRANYEEAKTRTHENLERNRIEFEKSLNRTINSAETKSKEFLINQEDMVRKSVNNLSDFQEKLNDAKRSIEELDLEKGVNDIKYSLSVVQSLISSQHNHIETELLKIDSTIKLQVENLQKKQEQFIGSRFQDVKQTQDINLKLTISNCNEIRNGLKEFQLLTDTRLAGIQKFQKRLTFIFTTALVLGVSFLFFVLKYLL